MQVPPGDPEALAATIKQVLDDPELAADLGARGRERVMTRYTWRSVAEQTVRWYRDYLGEPSSC
jgi:glycosyltransferase involved in cell wall biosynthesis